MSLKFILKKTFILILILFSFFLLNSNYTMANDNFELAGLDIYQDDSPPPPEPGPKPEPGNEPDEVEVEEEDRLPENPID